MRMKISTGVVAAHLVLALGSLGVASAAHAEGYECTQAFAGQQYVGGGVCLTSGALSLYLDPPGNYFGGSTLSFQVLEAGDGHIKLAAGGGYRGGLEPGSATRPLYTGALARAYVEPGAGQAVGTMSLTGTLTKQGDAFISGVDASMPYSSTEVTLPVALSRDVVVTDTRPTSSAYVFDAGLVPMYYIDYNRGSLRVDLNPMVIDVAVASVPEPQTVALMALGLLGLGLVARPRRRM